MSARLGALAVAARVPLAVVAVVVLLAVCVASAAAGTFAFDFLSYDLAIRRFLQGGVLYDPGFETAGPFGLFYYPPPFAVLALPLALLDPTLAAIIFSAGSVLAFAAAIAILPVPAGARWTVLLVGSISWPLVYAIKLGQVGPLLLLLFAVTWRWMDRPRVAGTAVALGTAIKVQPVLVLLWALATGRRGLVAAAVAVGAALAVVTTLVAGPGVWLDQGELLTRMSKPIDTPANLTLGRAAFEAGLGYTGAWAVQGAHWIALASVVVLVLRRGSAVGSYLVVVVASQLVSPILWNHYAVMILLPIAWLLARGVRWPLLVPLVLSVPLVLVVPSVAYPVGMWLVILATAREALREGRGSRAAVPAEQPAAVPA